jgi:hypothetical protein
VYPKPVPVEIYEETPLAMKGDLAKMKSVSDIVHGSTTTKSNIK